LKVQKDLGNEAPVKDVEVGVAAKIDSKTSAKAKINKDLVLGLAAKHVYNSAYTFTLGASIPFEKLGKDNSSEGLLPFDLGLQVDLNVWLFYFTMILYFISIR